MFGQMQSGAPMQGGAGKGGIQQPMNGGGKGGMNRGPGGNAQNNPGGMGRSPMAAFGQMNNLHQGLGSAGAYPPGAQPGPINSTANSLNQTLPMSNWQSMAQNLPMVNFGGGGHGFGRPMPGHRPDMSAFGNLDMTFGSLGGGGMPAPSTAALDPRPMNWKPNPPPYQPSTGWEGGQPAQWAAQAAAINNPPPKPAVNSVGLPAGGLLARLYGGG